MIITMDTSNKYTGFEKILQDKLNNHEYAYDHNDWLSFEKKLPKGKGPFHMPKNFYRYLIISAAVIIPAFLVLYFLNVFNTKSSDSSSDKNQTLVINNDNNKTNETSGDLNDASDLNQNPDGESVNNTSDKSSVTDNEKSDNQTSSESNNDKDNDNSSTTKTDNSSTNSNNNSQTNTPTKSLTGELISSDVVEGCAPLKVKFTPLVSSENITYLWAFGDGKTSSKATPSHVYAKAGSYTVTLTVKLSDNKTTKKVEYSQKINVKSPPVADFEYSVSSETDEYSFTDNSTDAFEWTWILGDKTTSSEKDAKHTYTDDGNYNVQLIVMNTAGCSDTLSKKIEVKLKELFNCPTAFTPNGDGLNDYFFPKGDRMNPDGYHMYIFDKNGILVFETTDLTAQWDGKKYQDNSDAEQGLYYWKISMKDTNNKLKDKTGYLTLMR
jgi:gliding motility-associated-like protein